MSSVLRKMFKTANALETKGITLEYGEGVEIIVARAGGANTKFAKCLNRLTKAHRSAIQNDILSDVMGREILLQAYAETVVLDWKGVTQDVLSGKEEDATTPLECTVDNVKAVFTELPDLFLDVQKMAQQISAFRAEIMDTDSKNL
ncbi:MAG: hypothetical protein KAS32_07005 [Candidatus Peribacteraceae bacterium]|nr:hypothetical protein [Candidatus Peribacteraceae bacterium]